jgi:hypothetical protein
MDLKNTLAENFWFELYGLLLSNINNGVEDLLFGAGENCYY